MLTFALNLHTSDFFYKRHLIYKASIWIWFDLVLLK
jgi:hypothetical protein